MSERESERERSTLVSASWCCSVNLVTRPVLQCDCGVRGPPYSVTVCLCNRSVARWQAGREQGRKEGVLLPLRSAHHHSSCPLLYPRSLRSCLAAPTLGLLGGPRAVSCARTTKWNRGKNKQWQSLNVAPIGVRRWQWSLAGSLEFGR